MAYTSWSVVFGEQPTAAKWNQLGANDAGFKDGTNIDDSAILTRHLNAKSVVAGKTDFGGDYTTSEVDTGFKYIDGKAIYKMTKNFTVPSATAGAEQTILLTTYGFPQVAAIIDASAILYPTTTDQSDGVMYSPNGYNAARGGHSFMTWSGNPYIYIQGNGSTRRLKVTLWYTKP